MRNRLRLILMLAAACGSASALVNAYSAAPRTAQQSGWTPQYGSVSEILTCCWDSLGGTAGGYVELFQGDTGRGGSYDLNVYEYPDGVLPIASQVGVHARAGHTWLRFDDLTVSGPFVKGRKYEFKFTRSGSDSVQFYFSEVSGGGPYGYGVMKVGNDTIHDRDLWMRLYSVMDPVAPDFFGVNTRLFSLHWSDGHDTVALQAAPAA
jgi:hypothetical protein